MTADQPAGCVTCVHARFPDPKGELLYSHQVKVLIDKTKLAQPVICTFNPVWVEFNTNHYCGQWSGDASRVRLRELEESRDRLWRENHEERMVSRDLRKQLKTARQRSAARLARINGEAQP